MHMKVNGLIKLIDILSANIANTILTGKYKQNIWTKWKKSARASN